MSERLAWAAGLIDGEGSFGIHLSQRQGYRCELRVAMTSLPTLERLRDVLQTGTIRAQVVRPPRIPAWRWWCRTGDLPRVLGELYPYLVTRRHEAWLMWLFLNVGANELIRAAMWEKARSYKTRRGPRG